MKELSIFVDESGDFGYAHVLPAYYLMTMVFHEQSSDISSLISLFDSKIHEISPRLEYVHSGPLIRAEGVFKNASIDDRRSILYRMLNFYNNCPITHETISVDRKVTRDREHLMKALSNGLRTCLIDHLEYFNSFENVIIYYDYGQTELGVILNAMMPFLITSVEFRKADPRVYKLLQVADFVNYIELLRIKHAEKRLSESEKKFFYKPQELKKVFIKCIEKKALNKRK